MWDGRATIGVMAQFLLLLVVALTVGGVVFGVTVLVSGTDAGLSVAEPDGRAVPLPGTRPLAETDVSTVRFDMALRGYRMAQVDQALRRAAYDIGYKDELISVLEAEVAALREGRTSDAEVLRRAREASAGQQSTPAPVPAPAAAAVTRPTDPPVEQVALIELATLDKQEDPEPSADGPDAGPPPPAPDAGPPVDAEARSAPTEPADAGETDDPAPDVDARAESAERR